MDADRLDTVIIPEKWFGVVPLERGHYVVGWAEIVAVTGQFYWPGVGISTVRLWAVSHGRQ
ncbi:hypothetical protein, partial [Brevibacterium sp. 239c]|uniref:hypothetical protein n=1 Tax=Brevibacterium sp. 239c TaxID=1965356 RepID=UPI001C60C3DB